MKRKWLLRVLLAAVVLGAFVYVGHSRFKEIRRLRHVSPAMIVAMLALYLPSRVFSSEVMKIALRALGHRISSYEAFMLTMVNSYANLLIPRAGLGMPALYMKLKHAVSFADFGSVQILPMTILQVTVIGIMGLAAQAILWRFFAHPTPLSLAALFAGVTALSVLALFVRPPIPRRWQNRAIAFVRRLTESWQRLSHSPGVIWKTLLLQALVLVLRAFRLQLAFHAVGQPVNFFAVFIASAMADLAFLISVTPSALGFREGAISLAAGIMGTTVDIGLAAAFLDRLVTTAAVIGIAQIGLWQFIRPSYGQIRKAEQAEDRLVPSAAVDAINQLPPT